MKPLLLFQSHRSRKPFLVNDQAVLGLPMRLTVALIIGAVALTAILGFIIQPCLFPGKMIVSVEPMIFNKDSTAAVPPQLDITVTVQDSNGRPVIDALVIITGLEVVLSDSTDVNGVVDFIDVDPDLGDSFEGYLDVRVKAPCFETFDQADMIKIIDVPSS
jgi:hypothetical protein